jgi:hypothetical protein
VALSLVCALTVLAVFLWRAFYAHLSFYGIGWVSGVWLGLARDLVDGVFYRPLLSEAGYGGTRYMPLHFSLFAALMKLGVPPLTAGFVASVTAAAALVGALAVWMRRAGAPHAAALLIGALALAPYFVQDTVFELRSDVLATALEVVGLAFLFAGPITREARLPDWRIAVAALCFVLAWLTKVTALAGLAGAIGALWFGGARTPARRLTAAAAAGLILASAFVLVASHGRVWDAFLASAPAGAGLLATLSSLIVPGPLALFAESLFLKLSIAVAVVAVFWDRQSALRDPAVWFLALSAVGTMLLLTSPGTTLRNHVVEPYVAAVLVIGTWMARRPERHAAGILVAASLAAIATQHVVRDPGTAEMVRNARTISAERQALITAVDRFTVPVLSESAVYPVIAGRRPLIADPFALRNVVSRRPDIAADLLSKIDQRFFHFVVLEHDPETPEGVGFYKGLHFGTPIIARITANYRFEKQIGTARIYVAK